MNLFDAIQQWLETTIIKPITDRVARNEADMEKLAARMLELSKPQVQQPTGDLSFFAQRVHTLEEKVTAYALRTQKLENVSVDIDAVRRLLDDELDGDAFRDRTSDIIRLQIENDESVQREIEDMCKEFLDNELDDLQIEIRRG